MDADLPRLARLRLDAADRQGSDVRQLVSDRAHPPRANDVQELRQLQKSAGREWDEAREGRRAESLSLTLRSSTRTAGPRVIRGEPRDGYMPTSPRVMAPQNSGFVKAVSDAGLKPTIVYHNLSPAELYEKALQYEPSSHIVAGGALATVSGAKTGRSPGDKRIVREPDSEAEVWWGEGSPNYEMDERTFLLNRERAVDYLNQLQRLYVFDGFACWDSSARHRIRVVCARPSHALFAHNMLIRPTEEELAEQFGRPDFTILNAGAFPANRRTAYMTSSTSVCVSFARREMVILGSQYAGNMKQGLFTLMNWVLPRRGVLPLNAGCCVAADGGGAALFFGLSGTGKTTFSTDPARRVVGDDTAGWGDGGVFNLEGGCYAKTIGLSAAREPGVTAAIRFGAVLENVVFDEDSRQVDYDSAAITDNTRAAFPIEHMANAWLPCAAGHPANAVFLCCDLLGVLPPVARLSPDQALYYFVSGYTAKVAGTEQGLTAPRATFSPCYTAASLAQHPTKYAAMLGERLRRHGTAVWLVNTGWTGGGYGAGHRIALGHTRAIVAAIHSGELAAAPGWQTVPVFNLQAPTACPGVPANLLLPSAAWTDQAAYAAQAAQLARLFADNWRRYERGSRYMSAEEMARLVAAGPALPLVAAAAAAGSARPCPAPCPATPV